MPKIKPFKGWLPVPVLPAAQVQATSYAQHLAYLQWYLDYLANEINNAGVPQTKGTAKLVDTTNTERGTLDYTITGDIITATVHITEAFVTTDLALKVVGLPDGVQFAGNIEQQSFAVTCYDTDNSLMRIYRMFVVSSSVGNQIGCQNYLNNLYASNLINCDKYTFTARIEHTLG